MLLSTNRLSELNMNTALLKETLLKLIDLANQNNKKLMLFGGWAVEMHVGKPFRDHEDIDIAVMEEDFDWWKEQVQKLDFEIKLYPPKEEMNDNFACFAEKDGMIIDMAAVRVDAEGKLTWIDEKEPIKTDKTFKDYYEEVQFEGLNVWIVKKQILLDSKKKSQREKDREDARAMETTD